jgi:Protein of unknown function (DUF2838)
MSEPVDIPRSKPKPAAFDDAAAANFASSLESHEDDMDGPLTPSLTPGYASSTPNSPYLLSRNSSYIGSQSAQSMQEEWETPLDRLTFFDIFDNLAVPSKLDKLQQSIQEQRQRFKERREKLQTDARTRAVAEWRKRVPTSEEQLAKYRSRVKKSVDDLNKRWSDMVTISAKEKVSFISAVLNVFISGYLIGAVPQYFYLWFTAQLLYFMPIRLVTYRKSGMHYFLADLCYFVNLITFLTIWCFPRSKRLLIATYCLAYGNNAVAIVMWRNSLVFHSLDKVTSLFIHVMPPVTLHCMVHLTPEALLQTRFPAIYNIKFSEPSTPEHYTLLGMLAWASLPYAVWQLSYHFLITVRKREQIAAGRPTSFTWLRRSYAKTWIGKFVLSLPNALQEPAFMVIQYSYALLTILPCPLWFWYRWASGAFLVVVFTWSIWNGANYYMDVFGKRFQKELEQVKSDVAKWQNSPGGPISPPGGPMLSPPAIPIDGEEHKGHQKNRSIDKIPLLDSKQSVNGSPMMTTKEQQGGQGMSTGADVGERKSATGLVFERRFT